MNRFQPSKMLARVDEERHSLTLDELTFQLCQLEAALEFRIGDVPASQIIRAATRRLELQRREIEALRTASETSDCPHIGCTIKGKHEHGCNGPQVSEGESHGT